MLNITLAWVRQNHGGFQENTYHHAVCLDLHNGNVIHNTQPKDTMIYPLE